MKKTTITLTQQILNGIKKNDMYPPFKLSAMSIYDLFKTTKTDFEDVMFISSLPQNQQWLMLKRLFKYYK